MFILSLCDALASRKTSAYHNATGDLDSNLNAKVLPYPPKADISKKFERLGGLP